MSKSNMSTDELTTYLIGKIGFYWPEKTFSREKAAAFVSSLAGWDKSIIGGALAAIAKRHGDTLPSGPELITMVEEIAREQSGAQKRKEGVLPTLKEGFYCPLCGGGGSFYAVVWWNNWKPIHTMKLIIHPNAVTNKIAVAALPCSCEAGDVYCEVTVRRETRRKWLECRLPGCWTTVTARDRRGALINDAHGFPAKNPLWLAPDNLGWLYVTVCSMANTHNELIPALESYWKVFISAVWNEAGKSLETQRLEGYEGFLQNINQLEQKMKFNNSETITSASPLETRDLKRENFRAGGEVPGGVAIANEAQELALGHEPKLRWAG